MSVRGHLCVGRLDIIYPLYKKLGMICYFGIPFYECKRIHLYLSMIQCTLTLLVIVQPLG